MGDLGSELEQDHDEVEGPLFGMKGDPAGGTPPEQRESLVDQVAKAVSKHEVVEAIRAVAPTRPHPPVPPEPELRATTGTVVGALDRARDLLARRG